MEKIVNTKNKSDLKNNSPKNGLKQKRKNPKIQGKNHIQSYGKVKTTSKNRPNW